MRFDVITIFPEIFSAVRDIGVVGRAHQRGIWSLHLWNPRDFTHDSHQTVDDRPYGGGPGMVMMAQPLYDTLMHIRQQRGPNDKADVALMTPSGNTFNHDKALDISATDGLIIVCGRYEGIDQRFIDKYITKQISIGDFVLSGGEIAALSIIDSVVRLLPGSLGHKESASNDSFNDSIDGLLDSTHYTRPEVWQGDSVPNVLLSGDHARINRWRREQSLMLSLSSRPDLINQAYKKNALSAEDKAFLNSLKNSSSDD